MRFLTFVLLLFTMPAFAQETKPETSAPNPFKEVDSLYREDQFYFAITYNVLRKKVDGLTQNGIPVGFYAGVLRDMPLNKKRTKAIALGLGLGYNKYHHNLKTNAGSAPDKYTILENVNYDTNKLEEVFVEAPIEFRWRNSTPESTKFWRVYAGFKLRYLIFDKTAFSGATHLVIFHNNDLEKWQFGPMISAGYNTWNFHLYYGLTPLYKSGTVNSQKIDMSTLNIGLMFYIL